MRFAPAIYGAQLTDRAQIRPWREQPAGEIDVDEVEPEGPDPFAVLADAGHDGDVVPRIAGGHGKADPVRPEIPVFGHDEHQAGRHGADSACQIRRIRTAWIIRERSRPPQIISPAFRCTFGPVKTVQSPLPSYLLEYKWAGIR